MDTLKVIEHFDNRIDGLVRQLNRLEQRLNDKEELIHCHFNENEIQTNKTEGKIPVSRLSELFNKMNEIRPTPISEPFESPLDDVLNNLGNNNVDDPFTKPATSFEESTDTPDSLREKVQLKIDENKKRYAVE